MGTEQDGKEPPTDPAADSSSTPKPRGFAAMTTEQRRALGSKGGRTAHERGTANKFTPDSASLAGRIPHANGTAHKWSSEEARAAGRKGGSAPRRGRTSSTPPDADPTEG